MLFKLSALFCSSLDFFSHLLLRLNSSWSPLLAASVAVPGTRKPLSWRHLQLAVVGVLGKPVPPHGSCKISTSNVKGADT